jgi:SAM-dependent methyltransferase
MSSATTAAAAEAAQKWSKTANSYVKYFQPSGTVIGRYLLNCMKLQYHHGDGLKVLEAGCGTGALAKDMLRSLEGLSISELVVTDIADGMLEKAKTNLKEYMEKDSSTNTPPKVTVEKADFADFHSYPNDTFDRYYANLCLCYASDPDAVMKEACRVLKTNGIAGFTAWGSSKNSPLMTIVPNVLHDMNLVLKDPNKRSSFHLGEDDDALRRRFLQSGFTTCTVFHIPAAMECLDACNYAELIIDGAASTKEQIDSFSEEDQKKVRREVYNRAKAILDEGKPMSLDILIVVAQK